MYVDTFFSTTTDAYDTDKMRDEFLMQFSPSKLAIRSHQPLVFQFLDKKMLMLSVKELEGRSCVPLAVSANDLVDT